ncbi:7862_t:CDS:10 [Funneliformis geosporum]|uniref:7862_t:CDS:1 n=1 Tax=Funneliformis geosporum TaxID=1117311 RepID=A0A9W4SVR5_9GLOM|nr:7862_t:CDS:10 [Funneliformis geosporum]
MSQKSYKTKTFRNKIVNNSDEEEETQSQRSTDQSLALGIAPHKLSFFDETEESDITEYSKPLKRISKDIPVNQRIRTQGTKSGTSIEPKLSNDQTLENLVIKGANKRLEIRISVQSGRGLFALQNISPGALVIEDIPYAAVVDDSNFFTTCSNCFTKGGKLSCCSACKLVHYCSQECQRNDWSNHQHECKVFVKVQRKPPTSIRLLCRILMRRMSEPASFKEIENLQSNKHLFKKEQIETFAQISMVVRDCVPKDALLSASEMIELFCRFTENSFSILDGEMIPNGVAVYPNVSLINHSCRPNCIIIFEKSKMIVRCIEPIVIGQEITINYTDLSQSGEERRKELQDRYFFLCRCELCEYYKANNIFRHPRSALRCQNPNCLNAIDPPELLELGIEEFSSTCSMCSKNLHYDVADVEKKLSIAIELYDKGTNLRDRDDRQAITFFEQSFNIQYELLHKANYYLIRTCKSMVEIYCNLRDWKNALIHSFELIESYRILYSKLHPLLGIQLYSTARIYLSFNDNEIDVKKLETIEELLREALKILEITHGFKHPLTKMVEMNLWDVEEEKEPSAETQNQSPKYALFMKAKMIGRKTNIMIDTDTVRNVISKGFLNEIGLEIDGSSDRMLIRISEKLQYR